LSLPGGVDTEQGKPKIKASKIKCPHCDSREGFHITTLEYVVQDWSPEYEWTGPSDCENPSAIKSIVEGTCLVCNKKIPMKLLKAIVYDRIEWPEGSPNAITGS
jgi:hypothetical protein